MTAASTAQYQAYTNSTWVWAQDPGTGANAELTTALNTWITAVNANAAQSGKALSLVRDHTHSTSATVGGFVIKVPMLGSTDEMYYQFMSASGTTATFRVGTSFTDDTSSNGYGTVGNILDSYFSTTGFKYAVTTSSAVIVATSTVNTEEFFLYAWAQEGSTSYNGCVLIAKDHNNEWAFVSNISSSWLGVAYDPIRVGYAKLDGPSTFNNSSVLGPLALYTNDLTTATEQQTGCFGFASAALYSTAGNNAQGYYTDIAGSTDQIIKTCYYGPNLRYATV